MIRSILILIAATTFNLNSCSVARGPGGLSSKQAYLLTPSILDIDCSAVSPDVAFTSIRGRVNRASASTDAVYGALSVANSNHASAVTPPQTGNYSGRIVETNSEVTIDLTPGDSTGQIRRIRVNSGNTPSTLMLAAIPEIKMKCLISRFSGAAVSRVFPTCNGAGTVTAGWYIDGKLVSHDTECDNKITACVNGQSSQFGWQVFAKSNRRAITLSRCGGERKLPACEQAGTALQGWYLDGKLISADGQCHLRGISCDELGSKREGWYTHERMPTKFLQAADCRGVDHQIASTPARTQRTAAKTDDQSR